MARGTNQQVIEAFLSGKALNSSNRNLRTNGQSLTNYSTVIAEHTAHNTITVNYKRYSQTTRIIQNKLITSAWDMGYAILGCGDNPLIPLRVR